MVPTLGKLEATREWKLPNWPDSADEAPVSRVAVLQLQRGGPDARASTIRTLAPAPDLPPHEPVG